MNLTDAERAAWIEKILQRAHPPNENGCRLWKGKRYECSCYPKLRIGDEVRNAHAWIWTLNFGAPPKRTPVMHKCNNQTCVSLEHLELGTNSQNTRDAWRDGLRKHRGRLCETSVRLMRQLYVVKGMSNNAIAELLNVSPLTVYKIVTRRRRDAVSDWMPVDVWKAQ